MAMNVMYLFSNNCNGNYSNPVSICFLILESRTTTGKYKKRPKTWALAIQQQFQRDGSKQIHNLPHPLLEENSTWKRLDNTGFVNQLVNIISLPLPNRSTLSSYR